MIEGLEFLRGKPFYDIIRRWYEGDPTVSTIATYIGMTVVSTEPGRAVLTLEARRELANVGGTLHGGIITTVADCAMSTALVGTLREGESFASIEMKINFLKAARGLLTFEGRILQRGRTIAYGECSVTDAAGRLVARISSFMAVLQARPDGADGS